VTVPSVAAVSPGVQLVAPAPAVVVPEDVSVEDELGMGPRGAHDEQAEGDQAALQDSTSIGGCEAHGASLGMRRVDGDGTA
jgi:hypothetical protein